MIAIGNDSRIFKDIRGNSIRHQADSINGRNIKQ